MPGSQLINDPDLGKIWTIPCDIEINISFNFGGKNFPVHPLDTSLDFNATDSNGDHVCYGAVSLFSLREILPILINPLPSEVSTHLDGYKP